MYGNIEHWCELGFDNTYIHTFVNIKLVLPCLPCLYYDCISEPSESLAPKTNLPQNIHFIELHFTEFL